MNLKFWKRGQTNSTTGPKLKLPRPKELPERVGIYMVTQLKEDPDWVWTLKAVLRPRMENRHIDEIRIYDPRDTMGKRIAVENFTSLDSFPELILYSGSIDRSTGKLQLEKPAKAA